MILHLLNIKKLRLLAALLLTLFPLSLLADNYLFKDGKSDYIIICNAPKGSSEYTSAMEMQTYVQKINGVILPINSKEQTNKKHIYIGYNEKLRKLGIKQPADSNEGFVYKTMGEDLYIFGGKQLGTMYGVFSFLEDQLGIHWYTKDYVKIPKLDQWILPSTLSVTEKPAFKYRHVFFYTSRINHDWDAHNKLNTTMGLNIENKYGGLTSYWGIHTMQNMVTQEMFSTHPEYFALINGKRNREGQLCLSNKDVIELLKRETLKMIMENPDHWCYSVSQKDNDMFCECDNCQILMQKFGGYSGILIWAINQVADEVKKIYPNVKIGTFAYHKTQTPPKHIIPRENVVIRLCDVECCFGHPIAYEQGHNRLFLNDLKQWKNLTDNIYIWDYATGFFQYLAPFPNIYAVSENLKTFKENNVVGVMHQGQYQNYGGEFYELKQWVFSKLLWNPNANLDNLITTFITDFYGAAAPYVREYYDLTANLLKGKGKHLMFDTHYDSDIYTKDFIKNGRRILKKAKESVKDDETLLFRVEELYAQILYLSVKRDPWKSVKDGSLTELKTFLKATGMNVSENETAEQFIKSPEPI